MTYFVLTFVAMLFMVSNAMTFTFAFWFLILSVIIAAMMESMKRDFEQAGLDHFIRMTRHMSRDNDNNHTDKQKYHI